jgi:hypothetical protein
MRRGLAVARQGAGLAALGVFLTGCPAGGTLEEPECYGTEGCEASGGGGGPAGTCDGTVVLATSCSNGPFCHASGSTAPPTGGVELVTPPAGMTLGQSLYNRPATHATTLGCSSTPQELIIDAGDPARSLLLTKVTGTTAGVDFACGVSMPPAEAPLSARDIGCLTEWVYSVAATGGI